MEERGYKSISFLLLFFLALPFTSALLEEAFVSFTPSCGSVPIHGAAIVYDAEDPAAVHIAVTSLVSDLEQITGQRSQNVSWSGEIGSLGNATTENGTAAVVVGTVGSSLIKSLATSGKVNVSDIAGKWETFKTTVVKDPFPGVHKALVIAGSDMRGAAFGVYTLSEQCGQSPFHFWADVPATKHDEIYALAKTTIHGEPSVKYRGLFINDEAPALTGWWSKYNGKEHQPLDSTFYRHVFDMMVRLKANFIWPGSWKSFIPAPGNVFFTDDPANIALANDYGIVVSTSHHEPMQRATNEWSSTETGSWDWVANRDNVTRFMEEGVRRTAGNDSYYTLGMRSDADGPIKGDDPLGILRDVFKTEREMLARQYGNESAAKQVWTIYKEVMTYYAAGLIPPEDVTLMFTDDNWGNAQRLPLANETARAGGVGLYYHLEYTGGPKAYKWQNTNNLAKVYKELFHALERGATQIWVINVGDIKPLELPYSFVMDIAWNRSVVDFGTIPAYLRAYARREFGAGMPNHVDEIADIWLEQSRLIGRRKYESTQPDTYSVLNFRENERVQAEWRALSGRVAALAPSVPEKHYAAFFHYLEYPIHAGQLYMTIVLGQGLNNQWGRERRNDANALAARVLEEFDEDFNMLIRYNTLLGGKWDGILDQPKHDQYGVPSSVGDEWWEPTTDAIVSLWYVQQRQNATSTFGNLGVFVERSISAQMQGRSLPSAARGAPTTGRENPVVPILTPYNSGPQLIDVYHRGDYRVPIEWEMVPPEPWVRLNRSSGRVSEDTPQQRIELTIDWASVPDGFNKTIDLRINFDTLPHFDLIRLPVLNARAPSDFSGFPADGGLISIEAPHFQRRSEGNISFEHIPYLGTRTTSGSLGLRPYKESRAAVDKARSTWVEYDIYLFGDGGVLNATVYINGALDTDPTLMMEWSLLLDGAAPLNGTNPTAEWSRMLGDPAKAGDTPPGWYDTVADHVWARSASFGRVPGGKHTLRWRTNSPEVYLEKIILGAGVAVPKSYLGMPERRRVNGTSV